MRVNIYAEEITDRVQIVTKEVGGRTLAGVRFYLELPAVVDGQEYRGPFMHTEDDDDSSAVTFWGTGPDLYRLFREACQRLG